MSVFVLVLNYVGNLKAHHFSKSKSLVQVIPQVFFLGSSFVCSLRDCTTAKGHSDEPLYIYISLKIKNFALLHRLF